MSDQLKIAFISAGAAIIVSIISHLVSAWINHRRSAHLATDIEKLRAELQKESNKETESLKAGYQKEIEKIRFEFSRLTEKEKLRDVHFVAETRALQLGIETIQRVKDEVQLILSAIKSSLDSTTAQERITNAREKLFLDYEEQMPLMNDSEKVIFHQSKSIALQIEQLIKSHLSEHPDASCLSDETKRNLLNLRDNLTEKQNLLRDYRSNRIAERLSHESQSQRTGHIYPLYIVY
jgi:hypothetical protein